LDHGLDTPRVAQRDGRVPASPHRAGEHVEGTDRRQRAGDSGRLLTAELVEVGVEVVIPTGRGSAVANQMDECHLGHASGSSNSQPGRMPGSRPCSMNHSCPNAVVNWSRSIERKKLESVTWLR